MFWAVLSLCVASCWAEPSVGYSYSAYVPLSHSYVPYSPYYASHFAKSVNPYGYPFVYNQPYPVIPTHVAGEVKTQYHTSDVYGQATYGHSESQQSHHAVHDAYGNKAGSYSYVKPDGHVHRTDYVADANGYRVTSNDLPVAPVVPVIQPVPHVEVSVAPQETPEVVAAKEAHFAAHAKALAEAHSVHKRSISPYASPVVTPNGYVADTPEVAAAKVAHFAEHAKRGNYYVASAYAPITNSYYFPYAHTPVVNGNGYLADTPAVTAAKVAHFVEHAKVAGHYNTIPATYGSSVPVVGPDGHLLDTPEVAAAKAAHFSEHAAAATRNGVPVIPAYASHSPSYYNNAAVVLSNGYLADTLDVAHAKAAHFAEYAKVASRQKRSIFEAIPSHSVPTVPIVSPTAYSYPSYPLAFSSYPFGHQASHTTVIHGPHAISSVYQV